MLSTETVFALLRAFEHNAAESVGADAREAWRMAGQMLRGALNLEQPDIAAEGAAMRGRAPEPSPYRDTTAKQWGVSAPRPPLHLAEPPEPPKEQTP